MSPTLNASSVIQHFKDSDAIEIRDRITFDFYTGLTHIVVSKFWEWPYMVGGVRGGGLMHKEGRICGTLRYSCLGTLSTQTLKVGGSMGQGLATEVTHLRLNQPPVI